MSYRTSEAFWVSRDERNEVSDHMLLPNTACALRWSDDSDSAIARTDTDAGEKRPFDVLDTSSVPMRLYAAYEALNMAKNPSELARAASDLADLHAELAGPYAALAKSSTYMAHLQPSAAVGCVTKENAPAFHFFEPDPLFF
jgi:hypothetical protein